MPINALKLSKIGPLDEIEFEFDKHVNVFTGANNSGKSTVLMALGEIAVYPFGVPTKLLRGNESEFVVEFATDASFARGTLPIDLVDSDQVLAIGQLMSEIGYSSFVPAIRRSTDFRAELPRIPKRSDDTPVRPHEYAKRERLIETDASSIDENAVVQKIIELDYRAYRTNSPYIRDVVDNVVAIASQITEGYEIRFSKIAEDNEGLYPEFETPDGLVPLNVLSQGTQSLIQWIAHLVIGLAEYYGYPADLQSSPGVLIIDEIDAHLHPSWQRRIIPTLTEHFPNLQVFCSTHSPLMLAGLKAGQVQLLKRDLDGSVTVSRNEQDIVGWSANEILRSFLNTGSPTDLHTMRNIERMKQLRRLSDRTQDEENELDRLSKTIRSDFVDGPLSAQLQELRSILEVG